MDENIEDLFVFYAMDALSPSERSSVEAFVASHPEAKARLDETLRLASALPYAAGPVSPPPALKDRLMDRVRLDAASRPAGRAPRPARTPWVMRLVPAVSLVLALVLALWGLSLRNEIVRLRAQNAELQQELNTQRTVLAQLTSPQAQTVAISGTELQPAAHGQLIADSGTGSAVLVVSGLKALEPGRIYEFWLIQGQTAEPAGLFSVDAQGQAVLQVPRAVALGSFSAVGVSVEPAGGSPQPGKDIVMLGKVY